MSELDEAWAVALAEAERRARVAGRGDIAEYIALRASNDLIRTTALDWLLKTLTTLAGEANRAGASISIENDAAHRFAVGNATMVGTRLTLRSGVRALSVEAGWPRAPADGFIRGGGLACARIRHFGNRAADEELSLVRTASGTPQWFTLDKTGGASEQLLEASIHRHLRQLLGAS